MTWLLALKWFGTVMAIAGAGLLALRVKRSGWGWVLFLASSLTWGLAGVLQHDAPLAVMQAAFAVANIVGICRWLIARR